MKIYREVPLTEFEFWAGARNRVKYLTPDELDQIEERLEELCPEGLSETDVNDLFWFEEDMIAEWLGYANFDEIMERDVGAAGQRAFGLDD